MGTAVKRRERWGKNDKKVMLCQFRCIVRARSKREIKNALNDLRNCDYWKRGDENFVNWSENPWIPLITVY